MGKTGFSAVLAMVLAIAMLSGCASREPTTTADFMRADVAEAQDKVDQRSQLATDWDKGAKLTADGENKINRGERMIREAEQDLQEGRELIRIGNQEIMEGQRMMQDSEERFGGDIGSRSSDQ